MLEVGTTVITPRFGTVKIKKIFDNVEEMMAEGYTNDSHYDENGWAILGKSSDIYHQTFAAAPRGKL